MIPDTWPLPLIDSNRCTGCGLCVLLCPTGAVAVVGNIARIVRPGACTFCEVCESYCPESAIGRPFRIVFASSSDDQPSPGAVALQQE